MEGRDERVMVGGSGFLPATVLAVGIIGAAVVFGVFHYRSRAPRDTIQVTGTATRPFASDIVKWRLVLARPVPTAELASGYAVLARDLERVRDRLDASGIAFEDIGVQPVNAYPRFDQFGNRVGYNLNQSLYVISRDVDRLETLALNPGELIAGGMVLESSQLEYFYSGLDSLKHQLLATATEDARTRAEEIAGGSGLAIDRIASARAGVFQITEPFSTEVSDFGIHNTATRKKEITVTVHATFVVE
ncbi:MAG: SIMPL domain-containing protein [Gemmatimonadota bacterium]